MNYTGGMYGMGDLSNLHALSGADDASNDSSGADTTLLDIAGDVFDQLANGVFGVPETAGFEPDAQASGGFATPPSGNTLTVETTADVQQALQILGYNPGPIDGINGPMTKGAVANFQRDQGLMIDGIAGPQTKSALSSALAAGSPAAPIPTTGNPLDPASMTQDSIWPSWLPNPFMSPAGEILDTGISIVRQQADAAAQARAQTQLQQQAAQTAARQSAGIATVPQSSQVATRAAASPPGTSTSTLVMVGAGVLALGGLAYFLSKGR